MWQKRAGFEREGVGLPTVVVDLSRIASPITTYVIWLKSCHEKAKCSLHGGVQEGLSCRECRV